MLLSLLIACIPKPHFQRNHPAINGTLVEGGKPLEGAEISFVYNSPTQDCSEPSQTTKSDKEGKFSFEETGEDQLFFIYGDRLDTWTICVELKNGAKLQWTTSEFWGGPPEQNLACRIEEELVTEDHKSLKQLVCDDLAY